MKIAEVKAIVGDTPGMKLRDATLFYELITSQRLSSVLELGFLHGVSTAFLAGAVQELGAGCVTTIGLTSWLDRKPNIADLLTGCDLQDFVEILCEPKTYNWRLMKLLNDEPRRTFDLCFVNSGHQWVDTGFAFFLAQRLLRPGGWLIFNSVMHTFGQSSNRDKPWVTRMTEEEQTIPQTERVFTLLVMRDENFDTFRRINNLGLARKRPFYPRDSSSALLVEQSVCAADLLTRTDPALRHLLLQQPVYILSRLTGENVQTFEHVRFFDSPFSCPVGADLRDDGTLVHYLERPDYDTKIEAVPLPGFLK